MKNKELIEELQKLDPEAEVFYGNQEGIDKIDNLPIFGLYDFDILYYKELRSCRSCLPFSNHIKKNVIVFEYS